MPPFSRFPVPINPRLYPRKSEGFPMIDFFHKNKPSPQGPVEYIVAGLGNPGREYENTRHNAGFITVGRLAEKHGAQINRLKYKALTGECVINGKRVLLMKPQTFMNNSGESITQAMSFYKIPPERTIIIFDDISLAPGKLRIRRKGSDGGQNGMKNIIYLSGKDTFPRVKMGIGAKPNPGWDLAKWVLSRFTADEQKLLGEAGEKACDAVELIIGGDIDRAMNLYNS